MNAIFFSLVLLTALVLSVEGKPIPGRGGANSGRSVEKHLERLMEKYPNLTKLFTEECNDVCLPFLDKKSALDCASCIAKETGSLLLSDLLTAISQSRLEKNCSSQHVKVLRGKCQDDYDSMEECPEREDSEYEDSDSENSEDSETEESETSETESRGGESENVEEEAEEPEPLAGEEGNKRGSESKVDEMEGIDETDSESSESKSEESASDSESSESKSEESASDSESSASESKRSASDSEDESSESKSEESSSNSESSESKSEESSSDSESSASESKRSASDSEDESSESEESESDSDTTGESGKTDEPSTAIALQELRTNLNGHCLTKCENLGEACEKPLLPCVTCILKEDLGSESSMLVEILAVMKVK